MVALNTTSTNEMNHLHNQSEAQENFKRDVINGSTLASSNIKDKQFDLDKAHQKTAEAMIALGATNGLQSMLAAQMLSVHELQQRAMAMAQSIPSLELQQYYTNSAVKLSNCFVQQTNALAKLQGIGGQKIVVERVDVHQGGQAVVGNIQGGIGS